ncbi:hypothetical protein HDU93_008995 [Gonapodya sp. JEL0774]|nr:hypothetical protein HDU93_008995 [Gonapodya sp. JEL0774]
MSALPDPVPAEFTLSLDDATKLTKIGPGKFSGEFVREWDRWDGNAQGGYIKAYITKALITAAGNYPHPVQISTDYLDVVKIGVPTVFEIEMLRSGKRFAYLRGTVSQHGKLLIATSGVLASAIVDVQDRAPVADIGTALFRSAPGVDVIPEPEDCPPFDQSVLMGRERAGGINIIAASPRPLMFHNLRRNVSPLHRDDFLSWRNARDESESANKPYSGPGRADGTDRETWGWAWLA